LFPSHDRRLCDQIQERITKLASGVAVIRVGAATEVEMIEKKHRIEDALEAVKSAQQEGVVPGGGVALVRASSNPELNIDAENEDQSFGIDIVMEAVKAPLRQMAENCGLSPDLVLARVEAAEGNMGYNFRTDEMVDMLEAGVIDPVKVTRTALQNAASAAGTLITTSHAIIEV
jgi:chaperonin GroEL